MNLISHCFICFCVYLSFEEVLINLVFVSSMHIGSVFNVGVMRKATQPVKYATR